MTEIVYAPRALADIERLIDYLIEKEQTVAMATAEVIMDAITVLSEHPLIGRPVEEGLRDLVISRGRSGYLALYRFDLAKDRVLILSIRHQREGGYRG